MNTRTEIKTDIGLSIVDGKIYMDCGPYQAFFEGLHLKVSQASERNFHAQVSSECDTDKLMMMARNRDNLNFMIDHLVFGAIDIAADSFSKNIYVIPDKDLQAMNHEESQQIIQTLLAKAKSEFLAVTEKAIAKSARDLRDPMLNQAWNFIKGIIDSIEFGVQHHTESSSQGTN
ncbi:hypothetical protein [Vibrio sp. ABG19]|uniref:hypothetical protein n=1 Tax=Vibrio sp. ABG19 TaxID=2817385 RepID=UPI00249E7586|nr:hypothetical protein [Vibrio sp. ABG19]WGY45247.1 hypothetical protein J0X00_06020 [Vibrio sp. ABG19]